MLNDRACMSRRRELSGSGVRMCLRLPSPCSHASPLRSETISTRLGPFGFTLVEIIVALLLTGLVVVLAHAIVVDVADATIRAQRVARDADRAGNRRLWLLRALVGVDVASAAVVGFRGTMHLGERGEEDELEFPSRLRVGESSGLRIVRLWLGPDGRVLAGVSDPPGGIDAKPDTLVLAEDVAELGFDYLPSYGADTRWVPEWVSPVSAPVAVRWRSTKTDGQADTALLYVGAGR
jgi:hypothetical protein